MLTATQPAAALPRFTFARGTLVHVLGPYSMELRGRGVDAWTGKTMDVLEHAASGDVGLCREGHDEIEVWIHETRLIAD